MSGPGAAPALVLQMQRMGDIVLSFPLFLWLARHAPDRPIWVVAEPLFYEGLKDLSPPVVYIPWTRTEHLERHAYALIVNLSHRPEAALLAGRLAAPVKVGPVIEPDGSLRVRGAGHLYRASLSHNNRHNRFHWFELNALDCTDTGVYAATAFDGPRWPKRAQRTVGLFLGASQESKRPDAAFYAGLAHELERRGVKTALFGGPAEEEFGRQVAAAGPARPVNFCATMSLRQFVAAGQTLDLLITPDTGPMHVAAWSGLAVLNLSMGPVNPWETGPVPPGHFVLRAALSCLGCWRCRFATPRCRERFHPRDVAYLAQRLLATEGDPTRLTAPAGLRLLRTGRTADGLYDLIPCGPVSARRQGPGAGSAGEAVGEFWRAVFATRFGLMGAERPALAFAALARIHPRLSRAMAAGLADLARRTRQALARSPQDPGQGFWLQAPPMLRPLAGYVHMRAQNGDFAPVAWAEGLTLLETVLAALT